MLDFTKVIQKLAWSVDFSSDCDKRTGSYYTRGLKSHMTTKFLSKEKAGANRAWVHFDAEGVPLGRLASKIATCLKGKNSPNYTPHVDCGSFVVVTNAAKVKLTGNKTETKSYIWHTGYAGGIKEISAGDLMRRHPDRLIRAAVQGMLNKGPLSYGLITKLKIFNGAEHTHAAQKPVTMSVTAKAN